MGIQQLDPRLAPCMHALDKLRNESKGNGYAGDIQLDFNQFKRFVILTSPCNVCLLQGHQT